MWPGIGEQSAKSRELEVRAADVKVKVKTEILPHTTNLVDPKTRRTNGRSSRRKGSGQLSHSRRTYGAGAMLAFIFYAQSGTCLN